MNADETAEEGKALGRILHAFLSYSKHAKLEVERWISNYRKLSDLHKACLPNFTQKIDAALAGIALNQRFLTSMVQAFENPMLAPSALSEVKRRFQEHIRPTPSDTDKLWYVLKNAVRDWAAEGAEERSQSYGRIATEIVNRLPPRNGASKVLVPGCGLGRLPFELSRLGYQVEGNEFSYFMLVASSFILNHTDSAEQYELCPWMHSESNNRSDADQMRLVNIPDLLPEVEASGGTMSMSAGDFVEVYSSLEYKESFDAVVTCFFLDTAHNIFQFIDIIHQILKSTGVWINLGPLLYHWADSHSYLPQEELSIEPSLEDVEIAVTKKGFSFLQKSMVKAKFAANCRSLSDNSYQASFWTVVKTQDMQDS